MKIEKSIVQPEQAMEAAIRSQNGRQAVALTKQIPRPEYVNSIARQLDRGGRFREFFASDIHEKYLESFFGTIDRTLTRFVDNGVTPTLGAYLEMLPSVIAMTGWHYRHLSERHWNPKRKVLTTLADGSECVREFPLFTHMGEYPEHYTCAGSEPHSETSDFARLTFAEARNLGCTGIRVFQCHKRFVRQNGKTRGVFAHIAKKVVLDAGGRVIKVMRHNTTVKPRRSLVRQVEEIYRETFLYLQIRSQLLGYIPPRWQNHSV